MWLALTDINKIGLRSYNIEIRVLRNSDFNLSVSALLPLTSSNKQTNRGFSHTKRSDIIVHSARSYICDMTTVYCQRNESNRIALELSPNVYSID